MPKFKVVTFTGNAKYTYMGMFENLLAAITYYARLGNRIIEVKEMGVRFKQPK